MRSSRAIWAYSLEKKNSGMNVNMRDTENEVLDQEGPNPEDAHLNQRASVRYSTK